MRKERSKHNFAPAKIIMVDKHSDQLTDAELLEKWIRISQELGERLSPEFRNWDYDADLYGDDGLPRDDSKPGETSSNFGLTDIESAI
jgi:hypothetical protein